MPQVSRAALPADAVHPDRRARVHDTGLPIMRALWLHHPDDAARRRARRRVPVGPGHARRARRARRARPLDECICRAARGSISGRTSVWKAVARSIGRSIWRRCRSTCARARCFRWDRSGSTRANRSTRRPRWSSIPAPMDRHRSMRTTAGRSTYRQGAWMRIEMAWQDQRANALIRLAPGSRMLAPTPRRFNVRLAGSTDVRLVRFAGQLVTIRLS